MGLYRLGETQFGQPAFSLAYRGSQGMQFYPLCACLNVLGLALWSPIYVMPNVSPTCAISVEQN